MKLRGRSDKLLFLHVRGDDMKKFFLKKGFLFVALTIPVLVLFQNFSPAPESEDAALIKSEQEEVSDTPLMASASTTEKKVFACPTNGKTILTKEQILTYPKKQLGRGHFIVEESFVIREPLELFGAGRDRTTLTVCVNDTSSAIQILSARGNVHIHDLNINVVLRNAPRDSDGTGGSGAAILVGKFLDTKPADYFRVKNVRLENLKISRPSSSYMANAISLIGNVSDVNLKDIRVVGRHSHALLMHWGGILDSSAGGVCSDIESPFVYYSKAEAEAAGDVRLHTKMKCPVLRSFHVHNVNVENYHVEEGSMAGYLLTLSSTYNITAQDMSATVTRPLFIFAGDEGADYAQAPQNTYIGRNILVKKIRAKLVVPSSKDKPVTSVSSPISIGSKGVSKWTNNDPNQKGRVASIQWNNLVIEDYKSEPADESYKSETVDPVLDYKRKYVRGVYMPYARAGGGGIHLKNIDTGELGAESSSSVGLYITFGQGVHVDRFIGKPYVGIYAVNSRNITVKNSYFSRIGVQAPVRGNFTHSDTKGFIFADAARELPYGFGVPFPGFLNHISISNTTFNNYDYLTRAYNRGLTPQPNYCARLSLSGVKVKVKESVFLGASCAYDEQMIRFLN